MSDHPDPKKSLLNWESSDDSVTPAAIDRWHKGKVYNRHPDKAKLREEGLASVAKGYLPDAPIIGPETQVLAVGSCFAAHFILWLAEHGFNRTYPESPYNALLRFGQHFESPAVIAQQFRWAFGELDPASLLWIDKNRSTVEATEAGRQEVRSTLERTDVLILTLGLSEVWYDKITGEPLWRALTESTYDPERHVFRIETVEKTLEWLECIEELRRKYLPKLKIVFTVSPIPLHTTFRPVSAIAANSVSKSVLRAAIDEFLRAHEDQLNSELFYFPSYEMVTAFFTDPFSEDNRHLAPIVPGSIVGFFAKHFCEPVISSRQEAGEDQDGEELEERFLRHAAVDEEGLHARELLVRISELEEDRQRLQEICDDRQRVIEELDRAAKERLELVNKLDAKLKESRQ